MQDAVPTGDREARPEQPAAAQRAARRRTIPAPPLRIALHDCKYPLLRDVAARLGWTAVEAAPAGSSAGDYFE